MSAIWNKFSLFIGLIFFANILNCISSQCVLNNSTVKPYNQLLRNLFCEYNSDVVPTLTNSIRIKITYFPTYFLIDEPYKTIQLLGIVNMTWSDRYLKWKVSDYNNISYIQGSDFDIWIPDLLSHEQGLKEYFSELDTFVDQNVKITYNGKVEFNSKMILNGHCTRNRLDWPLDAMNCSIISGVSNGDSLNVVLNYNDQNVNLSRFSFEDRNWRLSSINRSKLNTCKYRCPIVYNIQLKRKSSVYQSTIIFPQLCISVLCLYAFWVENGAVYRLALYTTIFLSQIMYLTWLVTMLGLKDSGESIRIFNFFAGMSWIVTAGIIQTIVNVYMLSKQNQSLPPALLIDLLDKIYSNPYAQMLHNVHLKDNGIIIEEDATSENNFENTTQEKWKMLSVTFDIALFALSFIYISFHFIIILFNSY